MKAHTVGLWQAALDVPAAELADLRALLSEDECARADALRGPLLARRYVADHGWRRRLLGRLLGCGPGEIEYILGERGKPRLSDTDLQFNAARSAGTALYVTCEAAEVGVDIEEVRTDVDVAAMARRFFSPAEQDALRQIPSARRPAAAFACWTRKEAYVKAAGTGLVFPLSEIEVWTGDDRPIQRGEIEVRGLNLGLGMAAAIAVVIGAGDGETASVPSRPQLLS